MEFQQLYIDPGKQALASASYSDQFKYTTRFQAQASFIKPKAIAESGLETKASLDNLKSMLPDDKDFLKANDDLVFTAFNLFTANLANKNGDCILKDDAIDIAAGFVHRFADLEHNRWSIVGHAIDYGYHTYAENNPLSSDEVKALNEFDPFQVSLAAVIYKLADPYFAEFVQEEASNPDSPK